MWRNYGNAKDKHNQYVCRANAFSGILDETSKVYQSLLAEPSLQNFMELDSILNMNSINKRNFLNNFAPFISNNNIDLIIELFEESINQIERNGNASLIFLDNSFKIFNYFKMK